MKHLSTHLKKLTKDYISSGERNYKEFNVYEIEFV